MIPVPSEIEGKEAAFGDIAEPFEQAGFVLGGSWEFDEAYFDTALEQDGGETIYLRLPVRVVQGELDEKDARLQFRQPFLVRHVVHTGVADDSVPVLAQMGPLEGTFNQFQTPAIQDGQIHDAEARIKKAQDAIAKIIAYVH